MYRILPQNQGKAGEAGTDPLHDGYLKDALRRLDQRLLQVCCEEERRAKLLAGNNSRGWEGVRNLVRPETEELIFYDYSSAAGLLPDEGHVFRRVEQTLFLAPCETEALLVVLAAHLEPRYQSLYAVLQDNLNQPRPTERLLLAVLGRVPDHRTILSASLARAGRLMRSGFLQAETGSYPPLGRPFFLADEVAAVLQGDESPRLPGALSQKWIRGSGTQPNANRRQVIYGHGDRCALARSICGSDDRLLLVTLPKTYPEALAVSQAAWRVGVALGALPLMDLRELEEHDKVALGRFIINLTRDLGGAAWLLSDEPLPLAVPHIESKPANWTQRRQSWLDEASRRNYRLTPPDADRLASRYRLTVDEVREVFDAAAGDGADALDQTARRMGRATVRHSLRTPTQRGFDDLVLRDTTRESLERLVYFVQNRDRLAEQRDLQRRFQLQRGPIVLFSGSSGTGKTLAAEAIAGALGRPLHTVDIAQLVSKYIGDTEKHVDEILNQGERASAVLFFDEADVLFSNRIEKTSNASEQFSNMMVGYLLQRIERHDGLVILATNLRHAIDDAFLRRFEFRIEFPRPTAAERLRIWELMLPPTVERSPAVDLEAIAEAHRLVGGEIRNAALKAIFLAARKGVPLDQKQLKAAIALELLELGRISRKPVSEGADELVDADRGQLLRACVEALEDIIESYLRPRFMKEIHVVHGSPTEEKLTGKRPAVSVALFRLAGKRGSSGLRAGFVISAWSHLAQEEYELLGVVHEALLQNSLKSKELLDHAVNMRVQESHDFDLLHRFWSSHDHPVRASIVVDVEIA